MRPRPARRNLWRAARYCESTCGGSRKRRSERHIGRRLHHSATTGTASISLGIADAVRQQPFPVAFALIVGHGYSPELWHQLFGVLKLSELIGAGCGAVSQARPLKSRTPRPVPETSVFPTSDDGHPQGVVGGAAAPGEGEGLWELLEDIRTLLGGGLTDKQVAQQA